MTLFIGYDRRAVADALTLVSDLDSWRDLSHRGRVSVGRVMSYCWHPGRLERCLDKAEEGTKPPPIHVIRVNVGRGRSREAYYIPSDGNHRTEAARKLGRERIYATISGEYEARPEYFALDVPARKLWRTVGRGVYTLIRADLSDEVIAVLRALHVPART